MDPNWFSILATNSLYCRRGLMYLRTNNNIFVFSCICFAWLLAGLFGSALVCFTSPEGQQKFCPLKAPPCLLSPGAFEDDLLLSERWRSKLLRGWQCTNARRRQTPTVWVTRLIEVSQSDSLPCCLYCKSFGNVPCLCEYPHLSTSGLIMNSLMWWIEGSVS